MKNGSWKRWPVIVVVVIGAATAIWQWGFKADMSPVMSYGTADKTFFTPNEVVEGQMIELCFTGITWHRLCPSSLTTHLTPNVGKRIDLPGYQINMPPQIGPVKPKCRPWVAPAIGDRSPQMIFSGFAESLCGKPNNPMRIITNLPAVPITINKSR